MSDDAMRRNADVWFECDPGDATRTEDGAVKTLKIRGYAIVFDSPSERMGRVVETIDSRALDHLGDLNNLGVRLFADHAGLSLANTENGSLRLEKDERGIRIEADLDARRGDARNLYYAIERGDIDKMSFGFRVGDEDIREDDAGVTRVHVTRIERLYEVSGVNFPAYNDTEVAAALGVDVDADTEDRAADPGSDSDSGLYERARAEHDTFRH